MKVTDNKIWQCPKCNAILEKGGLGNVVFPSESTKQLYGTGTCNNCGASFTQSDIYGGKYDYIEPLIKRKKIKPEKPKNIKLIIFREGQDQPSRPNKYYKDIIKRKYGSKKINIETWRIAGTLRALTINEARSLYTSGKNTGMLPDFGTPSDDWEGEGLDGRSIVSLFFF